ncbi:hypothetical protein AB4Y40_40935 [Paraburkholderia sp. EG287B]|uniref:glycosyltransferase family protein n=1 Tax=Paraburkholderia sp. EG287B TaxID=3237010 RepID=UPI0034D210B0
MTQDIALYGHSWIKKSRLPRDILRRIPKEDIILGASLNALHNKARMVLNADRTVSLGLNMRYFEVLASGSCLLTDKSEVHAATRAPATGFSFKAGRAGPLTR